MSVDATTRDATTREWDQVRQSRSASQEELLRLLEALTQAQARALEAQQAYDAHVEEHHCVE